MTRTTLVEPNADQPALCLALELSFSSWKLGFTIDGRKIRIRQVAARDWTAFFDEIRRAKEALGVEFSVPVRTCYEAGRDGFWIHRKLEEVGIFNLVLDSSSLEVNRRARKVKTDRVDADKMARMLYRYHRGERGIWSVVRVPSPEAEDARRSHRERERLLKERTQHLNRIRSLLALYGLKLGGPGPRFTGQVRKLVAEAGAELGTQVRREIERECVRLDLVYEQVKEIGKECRETLKASETAGARKAERLMTLNGIGEHGAWILAHEFFGWRNFDNRRQVASAAGLTPTPFTSGKSIRDQGISKAGSSRIRNLVVEQAWCWLRFQPDSELSRWYREKFEPSPLKRVEKNKAKRMRKVGIVALARKLLIALWKYVERGIVPEGAILKAAT